MKNLITIFSEAHVLFSVAFYFSIILVASLSSILKDKDTTTFKLFIVPLEFISILFLFTNTISVFKMVLLGEIFYYIFVIIILFTKKKISNLLMYSIGFVLAGLVYFSNLLSKLSEINIRWYGVGLVFIIVLYIALNSKKRSSIHSRIHFINAISVLVLVFGFTQDGVFIMLMIRLVFLSLILKNLIEFEHSSFDAIKRRYDLIQKDFDDEVRKKVKIHLFHMEQSKERMAEIAKLDNMTKVLNKKTIMDAIKDSILDKKTTTFSILMFDIDMFKQINDNMGHIKGDKCIVEVARIAKEMIRSGDLVGRYGGDEFIIVLNKADLNTAVIVAERLRQRVEKTTDPGYTISIGISNYPKDGNNAKDLIKHADDGLYIAKKKGRNSLGYLNKEQNKL